VALGVSLDRDRVNDALCEKGTSMNRTHAFRDCEVAIATRVRLGRFAVVVWNKGCAAILMDSDLEVRVSRHSPPRLAVVR